MSLAWVAPVEPFEDLGTFVGRLNRLGERGDLEAVVAVGSELLHRLFAGDTDRVLYGDPGHELSFRRLASHPKLQRSASYLCRALHIAAQWDQLPADARVALGITHHRELLAIRDQATKCELAERAAFEGWTAADLRREIHHIQPVKSRQPSPGLARATSDLQDIAERMTADGNRLVSRLDADEIDALLEDYDGMVTLLEEIGLRLHVEARARRQLEEGVARVG